MRDERLAKLEEEVARLREELRSLGTTFAAHYHQETGTYTEKPRISSEDQAKRLATLAGRKS